MDTALMDLRISPRHPTVWDTGDWICHLLMLA